MSHLNKLINFQKLGEGIENNFPALLFIAILLVAINEFLKSPPATYKLKCSRHQLCMEVLEWCNRNLQVCKRKATPSVQLIYRNSKTKLGDYDPNKKLIRIYFGTNTDLLQLISTIIHEYQHYIDIPNQKENDKYQKLNSTLGYISNPFEIKANQAEEKYLPECIKYLVEKKILFKLK